MIQVSKYISKTSKKIGVSTTLGVLILSTLASISMPGTALASIRTQETNIIPKTDSTFCSQLPTTSSRIEDQISNHTNTFNSHRESRDSKLKEKFDKRDKELIQNRGKWDKNRQEHYEKLLQKATTDAEKQAINIFKETVDDAVEKRRSTVDSAIADYRSAISLDITGHRGSIDSAVTNYHIAIKNAEIKAQLSCNAGTSAISVRDTFRSDTASARNNFQTGKNGLDKINTTVESASKIRRDTIATAISDFNITLKQASDTLKLALKQ